MSMPSSDWRIFNTFPLFESNLTLSVALCVCVCVCVCVCYYPLPETLPRS